MDAWKTDFTVSSIMHPKIPAVAWDMRTRDALALCERKRAHHLSCLEGRHLVGLVCVCDLEELALDAPVKQAIHHPPVALEANASIDDALRRMCERLVGSLLVVRSGDPVGILTREDVSFVDRGELSNFLCDVCGAVTHLEHLPRRGLLCFDCRSRSDPSSDDDELGGSE